MIDLIQFDDPQFDSNAFAAKAIEAGNVNEVLRMIMEKVKHLDASICQHVSSHHENLLQKVDEINNLYGVLQSTENRISTLASTMNMVKTKVYSQYATLQLNVTKFRHIQASLQLLKKIKRTAVLIKRIQSRATDLAKSSAYIRELDHLYSTTDWEGVHALDAYKRIINQSREDMVNQALSLVDMSFKLADQSQLGLGLQIFQNLGMLMKVVCKLVTDWQEQFQTTISTDLDPEKLMQRAHSRGGKPDRPMGPGRALLPVAGGQSATSFYMALFNSLDVIIGKLENLMDCCRLLGLTLMKNRIAPTTGNDAVTDACLLGSHSLSLEPNPSLAEILISQLIATDATAQGIPENCQDIIILVFGSVKEDMVDDIDEEAFKEFNLPTDTEQGIQCNRLLSIRSSVRASDGFLEWAADSLAKRLSDACKQSNQFKKELEGKYPRLLKLILDLCRHTRPQAMDGDVCAGESLGCETTHLPDCLYRALQPFETAYLSRSLSRLIDKVDLAFPSDKTSLGRLNTQLLVSAIVETINEDLNCANVHLHLLSKVCRNVEKTVVVFATKVEGLVAMDPSATQLVDQQKPSQKLNLLLVNLLCEFGTKLRLGCSRRLRNIPVVASVEVLQKPQQHSPPFFAIHDAVVEKLNPLCLNILKPLLTAVGEVVEQILNTMHDERFSGLKESSTKQECGAEKSLYIQNLQEFVCRVRGEYFQSLSQPSSSTTPAVGLANISTLTASGNSAKSSPDGALTSDFTCGEIVLQTGLAAHLVRWTKLFLWHVVSVRPTDEQGRQRLAGDCTEFELALTTLLGSSSASASLAAVLGPGLFACLHSIRCLLLIPDAQQAVDLYMSEDPSGDSLASRITNLPISLIGEHLFSRAPSEIKSPCEYAGLSKLHYIIKAVDESNESERLCFHRKCLAVYAQEVDLLNRREYAAIFPLLRTFMNHFKDDSAGGCTQRAHAAGFNTCT